MIQGFMIGRLGRDSELKYTAKGDPVCSFSIACQHGFGDRVKTIWVDCSLWGDRGKALSEHLLKGKEVAVQGEIDIHAWKSDRDGEAHANLQLRVAELMLLANPKVAG